LLCMRFYEHYWILSDYYKADACSAKNIVKKRLSGRFFVLPPNVPPESSSQSLRIEKIDGMRNAGRGR